jgi:hypothetical protein
MAIAAVPLARTGCLSVLRHLGLIHNFLGGRKANSAGGRQAGMGEGSCRGAAAGPAPGRFGSLPPVGTLPVKGCRVSPGGTPRRSSAPRLPAPRPPRFSAPPPLPAAQGPAPCGARPHLPPAPTIAPGARLRAARAASKKTGRGLLGVTQGCHSLYIELIRGSRGSEHLH